MMSKVIESLTENKNLIKEIADISSNDNKNLQPAIIRFVCYFNLFECFLEESEISHWYKFTDKFMVDDSVVDPYFQFFYKRYVDIKRNQINKKFTFKNNYTKELKENLLEKKNKLHTVLSISYYFRNNLYHGHKGLSSLEKYVDCFNQISGFLLTILENAKEKNNG